MVAHCAMAMGLRRPTALLSLTTQWTLVETGEKKSCGRRVQPTSVQHCKRAGGVVWCGVGATLWKQGCVRCTACAVSGRRGPLNRCEGLSQKPFQVHREAPLLTVNGHSAPAQPHRPCGGGWSSMRDLVKISWVITCAPLGRGST